MTQPRPEPASRRGLAVAVLAGLAGGGLAWFAASRPWARTEVVADGVPTVPLEVVGTDAVPLVAAAALVVVTGSLALLPTSGRLRRAVGGLVTLGAIAVLVGTLTAGQAVTDSLVRDLLTTASTAGGDAAALAESAERTWWRWVSLLGGLLALVVGAWATLRAQTWAVMSSRYEAPGSGAGPGGVRSRQANEDVDLWRAQDDGRDPTL